MGSGPSVEVQVEVDSISEPGTKCCQTASLAEYSYNTLVDELLDISRYPVDPMKEAVLKSCDVQVHGPDEFTVKVVLDGKKLDSYGYGKGDGTDRVDNWTRIVCNREKRCIDSYAIVIFPGMWIDEVDPKKQWIHSRTTFLEDPLRIEFYIDVLEGPEAGKRLANDMAKGSMMAYLYGALSNMQARKVKCRPDQDSIRDKGQKSVVSEPMDDHTDYDTFFTNWVDGMKNPPTMPGVPPAELTEVSETELYLKRTLEDGTKFVTKITHDKDTGEVYSVVFRNSDKISSSVFVLHREPLRFEAWHEDKSGDRRAGSGAARAMQMQLDASLAKGSSWFGW